MPAGILSTSLVVTLGERESVLLSPTLSLPISQEIDDSSTLYSGPSGMLKLSGNVLFTSTSNRGTGETFSITSCISISCFSSEKTKDRLFS